LPLGTAYRLWLRQWYFTRSLLNPAGKRPKSSLQPASALERIETVRQHSRFPLESPVAPHIQQYFKSQVDQRLLLTKRQTNQPRKPRPVPRVRLRVGPGDTSLRGRARQKPSSLPLGDRGSGPGGAGEGGTYANVVLRGSALARPDGSQWRAVQSHFSARSGLMTDSTLKS
jgi:hypothetical protein